MDLAAPGIEAAAMSPRRAITAAGIGNVLEYYDFGVYGFLAGVIARKFFPGTDEVASLLATFAAFGVGFLARPLGGIVLSRLARPVTHIAVGGARPRKPA